MIAFVIVVGVALIISVFTLMPDLPATPQILIDSTNLLVSLISNFVGLYKYTMTPALALVSIVLSIAILAFEPIYKVSMWILRKIPVLGIK